jgi:hypothetical protein
VAESLITPARQSIEELQAELKQELSRLAELPLPSPAMLKAEESLPAPAALSL